MKRGDIVDLKIESIAFGGAGVGRVPVEVPVTSGVPGTMAVFVEDTVPGDDVRVKIGGKKRNYSFGYIESFNKKAGNRVEPFCKHYCSARGERCGGCTLQNLSYEDQLVVKEQNVRDAIARIGGLDEALVKPIIGCNEPKYYRNKMEFSFSRSLDGELTFGLHVRRRHHDLVNLEECFLLAPYVGKFVSVMREFFRGLDEKGLVGRHGDDEVKDEFGNKESANSWQFKSAPTLRSLVVREGKRTGEIMINLIAENGEARFLEEFLIVVREFFEKEVEGNRDFEECIVGEERKLCSVYYTHVRNKKGQPKGVDEQLLWGAETIKEKMIVGGANNSRELLFEISPQSFFQPNSLQAEKLYNLVIEAAELSGKEVVYDLYCGAGTIGLSLAAFAKHVYGIEINESAILNARANATTNNIENVTFEVGDVLKQIPDLAGCPEGCLDDGHGKPSGGCLAERPGVVIVDPPRNGLQPGVVDKIVEFGPGRVVYVSCNPTTLARDLNLFQKTGYNVLSVQPVDMFPHTYHIETVSILEC